MLRALAVLERADRRERLSVIRSEMAHAMERGCGIYRLGNELLNTCEKLDELVERCDRVGLDSHSRVYNTEWLLAIELGYQLDVARAMAHSALERRESRGAHQRLDGYERRDDVHFLKHSLAIHTGGSGCPPRITYGAVRITHSAPAERAYGAEGESMGSASAASGGPA